MLIEIFIAALTFITLYYLAGYVIAKKKKDTSVLDIMWGQGFVWLLLLLVIIRRLLADDLMLVHVFIFTFTSMWGLRLSYFLHKRYRKYGQYIRHAPISDYLGRLVFYKALYMLIVAAPLIFVFAHFKSDPDFQANLLVFIGSLWFLGGFVIEAVSDQQLRNFKHRPEMQKRILKTGLWRYSRHPNHFGECVLWWGLGLMAFANVYFPFNLLSLLGPLVLTVVIRWFYGVPPVERKMSKHPEFEAYSLRTSTFILLPPKKIKK